MNKKTISFVFCALVLASLAGCAERWQKPGATDADYENTKSACEAWALSRFPITLRLVQADDGRRTPLATTCSGSGLSLRCSTTGGQYVPPQYSSVDENESRRNQDVRKCFIEKGWHSAQ